MVNRIKRDKFGTPIPPEYVQPANTKLASDWRFDASAGVVDVDDPDVGTVVLIVNGSVGEVIYNPANSIYKGSVSGRSINLDYDTSTHADDDDLYILCEGIDSGGEEDSLISILEELKTQTKLLKKILG